MISVICDHCKKIILKRKGNIHDLNFHRGCYQKYMIKRGSLRKRYNLKPTRLEVWSKYDQYVQECKQSERNNDY